MSRISKSLVRAGCLRLACAVLTMICFRVSAVPPITNQVQQIKLDAGWNLISFQVFPADRRPASIFASLGASFVSAWTYKRNSSGGVWTAYSRSNANHAVQNQITRKGPVEAGAAYWVYMNRAQVRDVRGMPLPTTPVLRFELGWNLVSIPVGDAVLPEPVSMPSVLAVAGLDYDLILKWELNQYRRYTTSDLLVDDFTMLDPNKGYWISLRSGSVRLEPRLFVFVRGDTDLEPFGNYPSYEDTPISNSAMPPSPTNQTHIKFLPGEHTQTLSLANTGGRVLLWELHTGSGS